MRPDPISECNAGSGINVDEMLIANGRYAPRKRPFAALPRNDAKGHFRPKCGAAKWSLFDHFVGQQQEIAWDRQPKRFSGGQIDKKFEFRRLLNRNVTCLGTTNFIHDVGSASI